MSYEPAYSPWGLIQTRKTLCPGFFDVSTASHGGIMVAREFVAGTYHPPPSGTGSGKAAICALRRTATRRSSFGS